MAQNDVFKRYLDVGAAFTQMTQKRAEAIVSEFVTAGEVQAAQAAQAVQDLIDRSRATTEALVSQVRDEVASQVKALGLATSSDIDRLEKRIDAVAKTEKSAATKATAKKSTTKKKATAKKSTAKKSTAKKASAKKASATKAAAKKSPAKKASAKKSGS